MIDKPNYYAIIPANVRYDLDLTANAKLLYGEITSLCNDKGYCWATNNYFSQLYGISERMVQVLLKQLKDKNYIQIEIVDNQKRKIYIDFTRYEKYFVPPMKNISQGNEKNFTHNNKNNNKSEYKERSRVEFFEYNWLDES